MALVVLGQRELITPTRNVAECREEFPLGSKILPVGTRYRALQLNAAVHAFTEDARASIFKKPMVVSSCSIPSISLLQHECEKG
jgi:hypothetical protein